MCSKLAIITQERDLGDTVDSSVETPVQYSGRAREASRMWEKALRSKQQQQQQQHCAAEQPGSPHNGILHAILALPFHKQGIVTRRVQEYMVQRFITVSTVGEAK